MRPNKPKCKQLVQYLSDIGVTWPEPPQPEPASGGNSEDQDAAGESDNEAEEEGELEDDWEGEESDTLEMDEEVPVVENPGDIRSGAAPSTDPPPPIPPPTPHGLRGGLESQESLPPTAASQSELIITPPPKIPKPPAFTPEAVLATWLFRMFYGEYGKYRIFNFKLACQIQGNHGLFLEILGVSPIHM